MVVTRDPVIAGGVAIALLALKVVSARWLAQLGLPQPRGCAAADASPPGGGS
jgi:hypothetical protein